MVLVDPHIAAHKTEKKKVFPLLKFQSNWVLLGKVVSCRGTMYVDTMYTIVDCSLQDNSCYFLFPSSSGILDGNTFDEYAVIIYMAVLRRMVSHP